MTSRDKVTVRSETEKGEIILLGQPNVGKSVIFGALTGKYVYVCNYPGTTVEISRGNWHDYSVVDAPGINSLTPASEDEIVARDLILQGKPSCLVQIGDSKNLRRTLRLTLQAASFGLPMVLVLNMEDEALRHGISIDTQKLSAELGIPVIQTVATEGKGLKALRQAIANAAVPRIDMHWPKPITGAIDKIKDSAEMPGGYDVAMATALVEGDTIVQDRIFTALSDKSRKKVMEIKSALGRELAEPPAMVIARHRAASAEKLADRVSTQKANISSGWSEKAGHYADHPFWGFVIMALVLLFMYFAVGILAAEELVHIIEDDIFEDLLLPPIISLVENFVPWTFVQNLLIGEYGQITMGLTYALAIVLPIVAVYFLVFGLLEDCGYLPRLSVLLNRTFKAIGLNGKAVLPMVLGLGCGTMAIMTTRILDSRKERIIATLLLALAIPCSAQLGVIMGMLGSVSFAGTLWFLVTIMAQIFIVGKLASLVLPGKNSDFIAEIPPFRVPVFKNVLLKTAYRTEWFLREAVPLFLLATLILFLAAEFGLTGKVETLLEPVVSRWLGLPAEAASPILMGFLRRDYGAAGLFVMQREGLLDATQVVVSMVTVTLFVPCIAAFFVMIKERGWATALGMIAFVMPYALLVGGLLRILIGITGGIQSS